MINIYYKQGREAMAEYHHWLVPTVQVRVVLWVVCANVHELSCRHVRTRARRSSMKAGALLPALMRCGGMRPCRAVLCRPVRALPCLALTCLALPAARLDGGQRPDLGVGVQRGQQDSQAPNSTQCRRGWSRALCLVWLVSSSSSLIQCRWQVAKPRTVAPTK